MQLYPRVSDNDKVIILHFQVGDIMIGGDFYLQRLPLSDRYQTEGWAGYDGYIRNQYDNFEEAYDEFRRWVDEQITHAVERYKHG